MHFHSSPTFTATPDGILVNGLPLNKSASQSLPPQSLRYLKRADELLTKVTKEDWDNRTPHATDNVPILAQVQMMLALASPQSFEKYNHHHRGPGPGGGQFTTANSDGVTAADLKNPRFKGMEQTQIKKQKFVDAHLAATEKEAKELNVPVENILGIAALESKWGKHHFASEGNNFFGLHYPALFGIESKYATSAAPPHSKMAVFESYEDSLKSFIAQKGNIIRGKSDPEVFMTNLQEYGGFGIDPDTGRKMPHYVHDTANTIKGLRPAVARAKAGK